MYGVCILLFFHIGRKMMKKYIFTTVLCIATIWMSACASGKKTYESEKMNAYERTEYFLTKEYDDTRIEALGSTDEKALYCESRFEDIDGITTYVVKNTYEYDYETGKAEKIESFTAENYSSFYVPGGKMLELDIDKNLYVLDEQRQVITKVNLTELTFPNQASEKSSINYIFDIKSDGNYVYVNGQNNDGRGIVLVLNLDLQGKAAFLADSGWTLVPMRENKVKLVDNKDGSVYGYKEERNKLDKEGKLPKNVMDFSVTRGFCPGNAEYDYFYYTNGYKNEDNGIGKDYLIGVKDGRQEKIFDFTAMGIADFYIMSITPDTQEGFYIWVIASEEEPVLYHFTPSETVGDYSGKAGKICCKIGSLWTVNNLYIEEFNKQSEDYYFEMVVYGDMYEDRDIAITHLFLDCQDGKLDGILLDDIEDELIKNDALYEPENYHNFFSWGMIMPVIRDEYGLWKDYFLATEAYEDKYGKYNRKHDFQIGMGAAEVIIPVGSISEEEAEAAVTALQEVKYVKPMKAAYENIILEEAEAYFTGNQDLDRTCDNMENRLRLALEENKD